MKAPKIKDKSFDGFYTQFLNLSRYAYSVTSIAGLEELRDRYVFLLRELKKEVANFKIESSVKGLFFSGYQLVYGIGGVWNDPHTQNTFSKIKEDIKEKLELFIKNPEQSKLLEKRNDGYYLRGDKIKIRENTDYYKFFDFLYRKSDENGLVSYKKFESILGLKRRQVHSARTSFFKLAKCNGKRLKQNIKIKDLIDTDPGMGLIIKK